MEEDYHRFLAKLPATLSVADRERIQSLSGSVATLWNAPGTSALDRKQIIRCVVERVIVVADKSTELNDVTIVWQGGVTTQHQVARPVGSYEQLKDYPTPHRTGQATPPTRAFTSRKSPSGSTTKASSRLAVAALSRKPRSAR